MIQVGRFEQWLDNQYRDILRLSKISRMQQALQISCFSRDVQKKDGMGLPFQEGAIANEILKPRIYQCKYMLPAYIDKGNGVVELQYDWNGIIQIEMSIPCFTEQRIPECRMINSTIPFHHHVNGAGHVCTGGIWSVAKNYGLYYFILAIGAMLNREKEYCDYLSQYREHYNPRAFHHWNNAGCKPIVENLGWAWNLN